MQKYSFSKSRYCNAVQCPKILWLKKYMPEKFDTSVVNQTILATGNEVGDLAMGLFGDFVEVPYSENLSEMIAKTNALLSEKTKIICEASFDYDGCFCSVDILRHLGENKVEIYEVKSSTEVKDIYFDDVAYQNYVLTKLGYDVQKVCLVHINNKYVRHGVLDLQKLFHIEDLTETARSKFSEVETNINRFRNYISQSDEPACKIGRQCKEPYECGFFKYCAKKLPDGDFSVFDISRLNFDKKIELYNDDLVTFEQLYNTNVLNENQFMQVDFQLHDKPAFIDKAEIASFLNDLSFPIYFLDFETFMSAVPPYVGTSPYQQLPFQYSLHYIEKENGELHHKEFLGYPNEDPRNALAEQLCRDIPKNVCVTAYNMSFEKTRIKEMAAAFPALSAHLMNIHDNIKDLMIPFQKKWYYTKTMQGSYSIKYVLPAMYPNEPSLDYHNLEGIHHGGEASVAFLSMLKMTDEEVAKCRENLLKYCGLDTYAMVKVWEKLREVIS